MSHHNSIYNSNSKACRSSSSRARHVQLPPLTPLGPACPHLWGRLSAAACKGRPLRPHTRHRRHSTACSSSSSSRDHPLARRLDPAGWDLRGARRASKSRLPRPSYSTTSPATAYVPPLFTYRGPVVRGSALRKAVVDSFLHLSYWLATERRLLWGVVERRGDRRATTRIVGPGLQP